MDPVPLRNCMDQLKSLDYSPILGNNILEQKSKVQSRIPSFKQPSQPPIPSVSSAPQVSPTLQRKRLFSQTSPPAEEKSDSKHLKMDEKEKSKI